METNDNKVSKYFSLPTLKITDLKTRLANADKLYQTTTKVKQPKYLFGIEVEVENCANRIEHNYNYWNLTQDNSLRNNGLEFVSYPLRMEQIEGALYELNEKLPPHHVFSGRTSVHIHMNVRDLNISQIINMTTLYLLVENVLFKWVGHNRNKNPFCIPISEAGYYNSLPSLLKNPNDIRNVWNKYSALNLVPITEKGTVEFRHMYGTADIKTLMTWVNMLACLKDVAKSHTLDKIMELITPLNTTSAYQGLVHYIFKEYTTEFDNYNFQELMEHNVTLIKLGYKPTRIKQELTPFNRIEGLRDLDTTTTMLDRFLITPPVERELF